jgi:hypothetical protein
LDQVLDGKLEHHVLRGDDILALADVSDSLILHVNVERGPQGGLGVFVKTSGHLQRDLGGKIVHAVTTRLGLTPRTVYIRNDVFFVERTFPMRFPFTSEDMPSVEAHRGTVTLVCSTSEGLHCGSSWEDR